MSISCLVASGALATLELVMSVRPGGIGGAWQGFLWAAGADPSWWWRHLVVNLLSF